MVHSYSRAVAAIVEQLQQTSLSLVGVVVLLLSHIRPLLLEACLLLLELHVVPAMTRKMCGLLFG